MSSEFLSREPVFNPTAFVDRVRETHWTAEKLGGQIPQNCNFIGEPRIGRTSFLHHLYRKKVGLPPGIIGLYVWVQLAALPEQTSQTFWPWLVTQLRQEMVRAGLEGTKTAVPTDPRLAYNTLEKEIESMLDKTSVRRLIFVIDDFDLLMPGIGRRDLDWLRALATRYTKSLAFVIASTRPLVHLAEIHMPELGISPLTNLFHDYWLTLLSVEEAEALCQLAARQQGTELDAASLAFLLADAGRHPDLLKVACEYLFRASESNQPNPLETVRSELRLDGHVDWLCRQLWQRRTEGEQAALLALARGESQTIDDRIMAARLQRHLGLVEQRGGHTAVFADVFRDWLKRQTAVSESPTVPDSPTTQFEHRPSQRLVMINGRAISLTPLDNRLLAYLLNHVGEVCTTEVLLAHVWSAGKTPSVVEKGINRLRARLEEDPKRPRFILSARGEGYILRIP
ncbi:MAG: winged helix-turn-helix domain-containing protein [Ardenticatenaceae bacterium]|nr:winged helix-turn-helix domain-containing protein [Ardenticatenaceae bacterium]